MELKEGKIEGMGGMLVAIPRQLVCTFWEDKKIQHVVIDLDKDDHILISFEKGYVVVSTEKETRFACKGKDFISLWN